MNSLKSLVERIPDFNYFTIYNKLTVIMSRSEAYILSYLDHLLQWHNPPDGFIYQPMTKLEIDTSIKKRQLINLLHDLKKKKYIKIECRSNRKNYYSICIENIEKDLLKYHENQSIRYIKKAPEKSIRYKQKEIKLVNLVSKFTKFRIKHGAKNAPNMVQKLHHPWCNDCTTHGAKIAPPYICIKNSIKNINTSENSDHALRDPSFGQRVMDEDKLNGSKLDITNQGELDITNQGSLTMQKKAEGFISNKKFKNGLGLISNPYSVHSKTMADLIWIELGCHIHGKARLPRNLNKWPMQIETFVQELAKSYNKDLSTIQQWYEDILRFHIKMVKKHYTIGNQFHTIALVPKEIEEKWAKILASYKKHNPDEDENITLQGVEVGEEEQEEYSGRCEIFDLVELDTNTQIEYYIRDTSPGNFIVGFYRTIKDPHGRFELDERDELFQLAHQDPDLNTFEKIKESINFHKTYRKREIVYKTSIETKRTKRGS